MPRKPDPWCVKQIRGYWYYKLRGETIYHTTGLRIGNWKQSQPRAERYAQDRAGVAASARQVDTFSDYAAPYFLPESCPWFAREHGRGNHVQEHYRDQHRSRLEIHVLPKFGRLSPQELSPVAIERWLYGLDYKTQTKKHILETLKIILRDLRRERLITFAPEEIAPPVVTHAEREIPTDAEASLLFPAAWEAFRGRWGGRLPLGVMLALAYSAGLRSGELRALQWPAVHWDLGGLVVVATITRDGRLGAPKAKSVRAVPVPRWTLELLKQYQPRAERRKGYVFPGRQRGQVLDIGSPYHALRAICLAPAGGPAAPGPPLIQSYLTPHGLRHAYNTRMRALLAESEFQPFFDGVNGFQTSTRATDDVLRAFTGHHNPDMTELYDHPELLKALRFFDKHFRPHVEQFWGFRATEKLEDRTDGQRSAEDHAFPA